MRDLRFSNKFSLATRFIDRLNWYLGCYFEDMFVEYRRYIFSSAS